jgi:hypothetical protein
MSEPIRHVDSARNDRKFMKLYGDLEDELVYLQKLNRKLRRSLEYALGRIERINGRLKCLPQK